MYDKNTKIVIIFVLRSSGIEPEDQDWKSGMLPLHHERYRGVPSCLDRTGDILITVKTTTVKSSTTELNSVPYILLQGL